jgi:hypothetical protein
MMHFDTLTVPPPRTDQSLMHNTTRGWSPSQKGLQVRFHEKRPFQAIFAGYSSRKWSETDVFL